MGSTYDGNLSMADASEFKRLSAWGGPVQAVEVRGELAYVRRIHIRSLPGVPAGKWFDCHRSDNCLKEPRTMYGDDVADPDIRALAAGVVRLAAMSVRKRAGALVTKPAIEMPRSAPVGEQL